MAKLSFFEVVLCATLLTNGVPWPQVTSLSVQRPYTTSSTEEPTTTGDEVGGPRGGGRGGGGRGGEEGSNRCDGITCPASYDPVCGSDGNTYDNDCVLGVQACRTNTEIKIQRQGRCEDTTFPSPTHALYTTIVTDEPLTTGGGGGSNSCDEISCPPNKYCVVNTAENRPECICNDVCIEIYKPVCGSDGNTYSNDCFLGVEECRTNTEIKIQWRGRCEDTPFPSPTHALYTTIVTEEPITTGGGGGGSNGCDGFTCPAGKSCQLNADNRPGCVCNEICYLVYSPVCGSDGQTYSNDCFLGVQACKTNTVITIQHPGSCDDRSNGCDGFTCPAGKSCQLNADNRPGCVCNEICYLVYSPVCGSDGQTYSNDCFLGVQACKTNTVITIQHPGSCDDRSAPSFPTSSTEETPKTTDTGLTCDGVTCPPGKSCQLNSDGRPECGCYRFCTKIFIPVCGSDGITYSNECILELVACETTANITVQHKGVCNDTTVTPSSFLSTLSYGRRTEKPSCGKRRKKSRGRKRTGL